jgi:GNAT superfamily N-acetyltransferase
VSEAGSAAAAEELALGDGLTLLIRPIAATDRQLLGQAFDRLSPETRYRRFFAPLDHLTEQDLNYLTEVDHHNHEALVAIDPEDGGIIAVARFVRSEDPEEAEVAVVVGDPWQGRGVGSALLERLVERAREEGIRHFVAIVLSDNTTALEMFRGIAPDGSWIRRSASGNVEMLIELPERGDLSESRLGRVLATVARERFRVNPWQVIRTAILLRSEDESKPPPDA